VASVPMVVSLGQQTLAGLGINPPAPKPPNPTIPLYEGLPPPEPATNFLTPDGTVVQPAQPVEVLPCGRSGGCGMYQPAILPPAGSLLQPGPAPTQPAPAGGLPAWLTAQWNGLPIWVWVLVALVLLMVLRG
jgi:hypothetical protein